MLAFALCAPAAVGQMPQADSTQMLSSSDVSDEQVQKAARIAVAVQMAMRPAMMKMRKEMKAKYGNPQAMDSTQKVKARKEMRRRQMEMRKKRMKVMQQEAEKEDMEAQMLMRILRSARQDSSLQKRIQSAMKAEMKERRSQMGSGSGQQGGGSN